MSLEPHRAFTTPVIRDGRRSLRAKAIRAGPDDVAVADLVGTACESFGPVPGGLLPVNAHQEWVDVVVVGGGPGGLGTAGLLTKAGLRTILLERGDDVATKWRYAYDRLHLNTSTITSNLPGRRFPLRAGLWPSRDDLVSYYQSHVDRFGIDVRTGSRALAVERAGEKWRVTTASGVFTASSVVLATGRDCASVVPPWPGSESFPGRLLHSSAYKDAGPFAGQRVLVVGVGNSGSDIAVDLTRTASAVLVATRTAPHIVRRTVAGIPNDVLQVFTRKIPARVVDGVAERVRSHTFGDLEPLGLGRPPLGLKTYIQSQARVPTIDASPFSAAVRSGGIVVVPALKGFHAALAQFADGTAQEVDAVVTATGYRPCLGELIGHLGVLDDRGWPVWAPKISDPRLPGLFIIGFGDPTRGNLRGLRIDARATAKSIIKGRPTQSRHTR